MYRLEIILPGLPQRFNENMGAHWHVRHAESKKWHQRVLGCMLTQRQPAPTFPLQKAKLTLVRYSSRCPDYDGLVQSMKPVVDALKKSLIIVDDSMAVIGRPDYQWVKCPPKFGKIKIVVEEIEYEKVA